ncbi:hypothetical protein ACF0H5_001596 [Mactra antiquata]
MVCHAENNGSFREVELDTIETVYYWLESLVNQGRETMHPPRIRSAPARRRKSTKTTCTKDIEDWVLSGKEQESETSRIRSGQIGENVTEERLLKARLMELGKERFKILSKCDQEIQSFKDKQKRKGFRAILPRPMSANNVFDRRLSISERSTSSRASNITQQSAAPLILITPAIRTKTVQFEDEVPKPPCIKMKKARQSYPRPRTVPAKSPRHQPEAILEEWKPLTMTTEWSRPSTALGMSHHSRPGSSISIPSSNSLKNIQQSPEEYTVISAEPRFVALEKLLTKNYITDCKFDVRRIIENVTSLNIPRRAGSKEAKRELEFKIRQFMAEQNIVF